MKTSEKICDAVSRHFSVEQSTRQKPRLWRVHTRFTLASTPSPLSARVKHLSKFRASNFATESSSPAYRGRCTPRSRPPYAPRDLLSKFCSPVLATQIPGGFFSNGYCAREYKKS